ncbi:MAG TPA: cupin domain-containing protein [Blastocatellia bacterium]|nr:cupin domain-containing protein [Blastocatellia bacterium]
MELIKWHEMEEEKLNDKLTRQFASGKNMTIARIVLKKGCVVPTHTHPGEQMSTVFTGALKFLVDGREIVVQAGETLVIPSFAPHSAEALEDTDEMDVFAPIREDWINGKDGYLRGK